MKIDKLLNFVKHCCLPPWTCYKFIFLIKTKKIKKRNSAAVAPIYVIRIVISFIHLLNFYFLFFDANIWLEYINCFIICAFLIIFIKLCRNFFNIQQETQTLRLLAP